MRRAFITAWMVLVLILPAMSFAATLKIATLSPEGTAPMLALRAAEKEIFQATEGRVKLKIFPGGVMGSDATILKKMKIGHIQGATFTAGGVSNVHRDFQILSMPLLFKNYQEVDYVRSKIDPIITKGLDEKGYVTISIMEVGFAYFMSSKHISALEELKGLKTWIPEGDPIGKAVFDVLGAPPVPLPLQDVLTGLQSGLIDSYFNSPVGAVTLQWYSRVKYLLEAPLSYSYATLVFSQKAFKRMTPQDQELVKEIFAKHMGHIQKSARKANADALDALKNQGITFMSISGENYTQLLEVGVKARKKLVEQGMFSKSLIDEINRILAEYRASKGQ
jgi:TRAP-type transport system periplasmic protein